MSQGHAKESLTVVGRFSQLFVLYYKKAVTFASSFMSVAW